MYNYAMAVCLRAGEPPPFPGEHTTQRGDAVDLRQLQAKEMLKQGMAVCR